MRRNWPDLLIGIALVAVIAGIIVTLLGGGSVFDFARSPRPAAPEPRPVVTAPQLADEPVSPLSGAGTAEEETAGDVLIPVPPNEAAAPPPPASEGAGEQTGATITPLPPGGAQTGVAPTTTAPATTTTPTTPTTTAPATPAPTTTITPTSPAATAPAPAAATVEGQEAPAAGAEEPWRILAGSFRQRENAERLAAEYRAEGHPVFIATQGEISYVVVGPFADEAQTRSLAQQFREAGREAEIRVLASDAAATDPAPAPSPTATAPATTAPTTTAPTTTTPTAPTAPAATAPATSQPQAGAQATSSRYIQAGAYRTAESAAPQRQRLESLGYQVTAITTDTGLIRLLIGPFDAAEAEDVRRRLDAQGIEHAPGPTAIN